MPYFRRFVSSAALLAAAVTALSTGAAAKAEAAKPVAASNAAPGETAPAGKPIITVKFLQDVYEIGLGVRGEVSITNPTADWITVADTAELAKALTVKIPTGQTIPATKPERFGAAKTTSIGPGGFTGFAFDAEVLFPVLSRPGRYTIGLTHGGLSAADVPLQMIERYDPAHEYQLLLTTRQGDLTIDLDSRNAPVAVHNIVNLTRTGFYDGASIPTVQKTEGFVVRGKVGPSHRILPLENTPRELLAGSVVLERSGAAGPGQANLPNLIVLLAPKPERRGRVTAIGQVVAAPEVLDKFAALPTSGAAGSPPWRPTVSQSVETARIVDKSAGQPR